MKIIFFISFAVSLTVLNFSNPLAAQDIGTHPVEISYLSESSKQAEDHFQANVVAYADYGIPERVWSKFLSEHRIGTILLDADQFFRDTENIIDIDSFMLEKDALVMQIIQAGGSIIFSLNCATPRFNSTRPEFASSIGEETADPAIWACSPPEDYDIYAQMITRLVFHFNHELNTQGRIIYNFGNEPDNYFSGTPADLYEMYSVFAQAAQQADPNVKIGGITPVLHTQNTLSKANPIVDTEGVVQFESATTESGRPLIHEWIEYSANNSLPINFVSWHHYPAPNPIPLTAEGPAWIESEDDISSWLQESGFQDVDLYLLDWPDWKVDLLEHDNEFYAAHIAAGYIGMAEETSIKPVQTGLEDINEENFIDLEFAVENALFGGGVGIYNIIGLAKPVNNTYSMFDRLEGSFDFPETGNPFIKSVSSAVQDRMAILLTNFIPSDRMINLDSFFKNMSPAERFQVDSSIRNYIRVNEIDVSDIIDDELAFMAAVLAILEELNLQELPPSFVKFEASLRAALDAVEQMDQQIATASSIALNINDLSQGQWNVKHYAIDKDHANVYTDRHSVHSELLEAWTNGDQQALSSIVDRTNEDTALESGLIATDLWQVQNQESQNYAFDMLPYSVHLIEIERTNMLPQSVQIIDDGDAGFATQGQWAAYSDSGHQSDIRRSAAGNGADRATWTFAVTPGCYRVSATWTAWRNRATDAPYTIIDDGVPMATVLVNQEQSPADFSEAGSGWHNLGVTHDVTGTTLTVELSDAANQYVIADAVRIERVGDVCEIVDVGGIVYVIGDT